MELNRPKVIYKSWRSEFPLVSLYVIGVIASPILSYYFPFLVLPCPIITIEETKYYLVLPIIWLVPASTLAISLYRIFNVTYILDRVGIEAWNGILSFNHTITRVRYRDIRGADVMTTIWGRLFNFGTINVGTAASSSWEIEMNGVRCPRKLQMFLFKQRDSSMESTIDPHETDYFDTPSAEGKIKNKPRTKIIRPLQSSANNVDSQQSGNVNYRNRQSNE